MILFIIYLILLIINKNYIIVTSIPAYVEKIPNGKQIKGVAALGHVNPSGNGPRNQFGADFQSTGLSWTSAFCHEDSDGDGLSNGQELGDPCCRWTTKNTSGLITTGLSHPGLSTSKTMNPILLNPTCNTKSEKPTKSSFHSSSDGSDVGSQNEPVKKSKDNSSNTSSTVTDDIVTTNSNHKKYLPEIIFNSLVFISILFILLFM